MILFAGDPHGSYAHLYPFIQERENVALVILGDLQLTTTTELDNLARHCDIWFIHGNHDSKTVAAFEAIWGSQWKERNIHGKVVNIQGTRIAGLGGVFRGHIWMPPHRPMFFDPIHYCQYSPQEKIWRGGVPLRHRTSIFPSDVEGLEAQKADILITHEAPRPHPQGFEGRHRRQRLRTRRTHRRTHCPGATPIQDQRQHRREAGRAAARQPARTAGVPG